MKTSMFITLFVLFSFTGTAIAGKAGELQKGIVNAIPKHISVKCKDGTNNVGKEVQCGMRIKPGFSRTAKDYHDLQAWAREVAGAVRNGNWGIDFSIMAIGDHEIPLARFMYSVQFDYITPIYMWR